MTVTGDEAFRSGRGSRGGNPRRELIYNIFGSNEPDDIYDWLEANAPSIVDNLPRVDVEVGDQMGPNIWQGFAHYSNSQPPAQATEEHDREGFDTTGGTQHKEVGISSTSIPADTGGDPAPDHGGAINVDQDGNVKGVDIIAPSFKFTTTVIFPADLVDDAFKLNIADLTATTNDGPFHGFATGEVLFLGAVGTQRSDGSWEVTYNYARNKSVNYTPAGWTAAIIANGWDYVWFDFLIQEDAMAHRMVSKPIAAHIEVMYQPGSFASLY